MRKKLENLFIGYKIIILKALLSKSFENVFLISLRVKDIQVRGYQRKLSDKKFCSSDYFFDSHIFTLNVLDIHILLYS